MGGIKKATKGFTLIELLVALAIFSVIIATIYATFAAGIESWRRIERRLEVIYSARIVVERMAQELQNAVMYGTAGFTGEHTAITFTTSMTDGEAQDPTLKKISYELRNGMLVKRTAGYETGFSGDTASEHYLLDGITTLEFYYPYRVFENFDDVEWRSSWESREGSVIPRGVRVYLVVEHPRSNAVRKTFTRTVSIPTGTLGADR